MAGKRAYRTASGKMVDMDTLALKNETVLAVGNMNVNARGDRIGNGGQIVQTREEVIAQHYSVRDQVLPDEQPLEQAYKDKTNRTIQPDEQPMEVEKDLSDESDGMMEDTKIVAKEAQEEDNEWVEDEDGNFIRSNEVEEPVVSEITTQAEPTRGLADALATTQSVSVPFVQSEKQKIRQTKGVKRL